MSTDAAREATGGQRSAGGWDPRRGLGGCDADGPRRAGPWRKQDSGGASLALVTAIQGAGLGSIPTVGIRFGG